MKIRKVLALVGSSLLLVHTAFAGSIYDTTSIIYNPRAGTPEDYDFADPSSDFYFSTGGRVCLPQPGEQTWVTPILTSYSEGALDGFASFDGDLEDGYVKSKLCIFTTEGLSGGCGMESSSSATAFGSKDAPNGYTAAVHTRMSRDPFGNEPCLGRIRIRLAP